MIHQQYQMPPGPATCQAPRNLGIRIIFRDNGQVAFVPTTKPGTLDISVESILACFDVEGFHFASCEDGSVEEFSWGAMYDYRRFPLFLCWLQGQQLANPFA